MVYYQIFVTLLSIKKSYFVGLQNSQDKFVTDTEPMLAPS